MMALQMLLKLTMVESNHLYSIGVYEELCPSKAERFKTLLQSSWRLLPVVFCIVWAVMLSKKIGARKQSTKKMPAQFCAYMSKVDKQ